MKHTKDSRKHYDAVVAARDYFEALEESKQEAWDNKSERWQEGDKGQEEQEDIDSIGSISGELDEVVDSIESLYEVD